MIHKLKIDNNQFEAIWSGDKTHEVRVNDRDYQIFDILEFEFKRSRNDHPRIVQALVTDITKQGTYELPPHVCCMSIRVIKKKQNNGF